MAMTQLESEYQRSSIRLDGQCLGEGLSRRKEMLAASPTCWYGKETERKQRNGRQEQLWWATAAFSGVLLTAELCWVWGLQSICLSFILLLPPGGPGGRGLDGPFGSRPTVLILFLILSFTVLSSVNMLETPESHLSLSVGVCVSVCVSQLSEPLGETLLDYMLIKCSLLVECVEIRRLALLANVRLQESADRRTFHHQGRKRCTAGVLQLSGRSIHPCISLCARISSFCLVSLPIHLQPPPPQPSALPPPLCHGSV